jgi:alcohol dehydrogenase YqhD (iron-dependent ADH family)
VSHKLEHELGGLFDVAHGAGLSAVWGSWARYVFEVKPERFAQFAVHVMDVEDTGDAKMTAQKGIEAVEEFFRSIEMPTSIRELGYDVTDEQIREMAHKCNQSFGTLDGFRAIGEEDLINIYTMAR